MNEQTKAKISATAKLNHSKMSDVERGELSERIKSRRRKHSKLTVDDVKAMRAARSTMTFREIADKWQISLGMATSILTNRTWRDV